MKYNDIRKYFKELFRTIYVHIILLITNKCQLRLFGVDSTLQTFKLLPVNADMSSTMSGCSPTSDIHFVEYSSTLQLFKLSNIQTLQTFQTRNVSLLTLTCLRRCQVVLLQQIFILWNTPQPYNSSNFQTFKPFKLFKHGTFPFLR